ncbi:MAG TPA: serine hydrolase, partial [Armatimonadota bacterium]|nr:serine hydrolase [Armatimonadota bacterium]
MNRRLACLLLLLCVVPFAPAADRIPAPQVGAAGVFLMDYHSGDTLWSRNADTPRCMASTTKMMTALLAAESS